jgi:hypothetical protein
VWDEDSREVDLRLNPPDRPPFYPTVTARCREVGITPDMGVAELAPDPITGSRATGWRCRITPAQATLTEHGFP